MSSKSISDGGIGADALTAGLEPMFQAILDDVYARDAAIDRTEALLAVLPAQVLATMDEAGFDLVRRFSHLS